MDSSRIEYRLYKNKITGATCGFRSYRSHEGAAKHVTGVVGETLADIADVIRREIEESIASAVSLQGILIETGLQQILSDDELTSIATAVRRVLPSNITVCKGFSNKIVE